MYSSLGEHQKEGRLCNGLREWIHTGQEGVDNFQVQKGLLCYRYKRARRRRWVVPVSLKQMLVKYFRGVVGPFRSPKNLPEYSREFLVA
jgi:hypothetical protein